MPDHASPENAAIERALRTFAQGLGLDLLLALAMVVYDAMLQATVDWRLLGLALLKTTLMTVASYVMRRLAPPREEAAV